MTVYNVMNRGVIMISRFVCLQCLSVFFSLTLLAACGGGGGGGGSTDTTPVAHAGPDQNVMVGWKVTLDGSGSSNASRYSWLLTPPATSTAALLSSTVSKPTFTADKAGLYTISLAVSNGTVTSSSDTGTIKAVSPRAVPDTGQTTSYGGWDDSYYLSSAPSYSNNGNGTITDNVTSLMWQQCTALKSGPTCSGGTLKAYNWYEATGTVDVTSNPTGTNACGGTFLGHSDWRLPTDFELMTIADYGLLSAPAITTAYFPGTGSWFYWSSPGSAVSSTDAWATEFNAGTTMAIPKTSGTTVVRCVRGEQSTPVLTDNNDGTITDNVTGLLWQKQDDGLTKNWANALTYCEGLTLAGSGAWRLPNVKELRSLADNTKYGPSIDTANFPSTKTSYYWASTSVASNPGNFAWTVSFNSGSVDNTENKTFQHYVRCEQ